MLVEARLLAKTLRISPATAVEPAPGSIRCVGRSLLALLIVEGVGEVHPETAVILQNLPHFVEDAEQMPDEFVRMGFVAEFAHPSIWPRHGVGAVVPK